VVVTGAACTVALHNVRFNKCTLVILNGAKALVEQCGFSSNLSPSESCGVCLYAHGAGTRVTVQSCKFTGGLECIAASDGAQLAAVDTHFTAVDVCAVDGAGPNTQISLVRCSVSDMGKAYANTERTPNEEGKTYFLCTGVHVHNSCRGELVQLTVTSAEVGISVARGGVVQATECSLCECVACGANVSKASSAVLTKCTLQGSELFHGLHVDGQGTSAEAYECAFQENKQSGAGVYSSSKLKLVNCRSSGNGSAGYWAQSGGQLTMSDCKSEGDTVGCGGIEPGSIVITERLHVSRSCQSGVVVDQYAKATIKDSVICDCDQACLMATAGAEVHVTASRMERAGKGHGLEVTGEGSRGRAEGCVLRGNAEAGAAVFQGGCLELVACESEGNKVAGFWSQSGGALRISDCVSKQDEVGCGARGKGSTVSCSNITVNGNTSGFLVIAGGGMEVHNGTVLRSASNGVSCSDNGSKLKMVGGQVKLSGEAGVCAQSGCRVELRSVQASGNRTYSFVCYGRATRMVLSACVSTDEKPYAEIDNATLICRGCYPSDAADSGSVFHKFKDLDLS
jgi:hypothetical protein